MITLSLGSYSALLFNVDSDSFDVLAMSLSEDYSVSVVRVFS